MTAPGPSPLPRLLRDNQHTVTHLLEQLTGEALVAEVIRQYSRPAGAHNTLGVGADQTVTHRIAVLKGGVSLVPYVYATSAFVPARLPEAACLRLERTSDPIGRVLAACGLALVREDFPASGGRLRAPEVAAAVRADVSSVVWSRAYRLTSDGLPVFAISEWFLRAVEDAFERPMPVDP